MSKMTAKERVMATFNREPTDRVAVITPTSVATVDSMEATGAAFPDVHTDAEKMATLAAAGHDLLGFDTVAPYYSVQQEAAAFGAEMDWGKIDAMPVNRSNPFSDPGEFKMPADFLERLPIKTVVDSIRLLKKKYGDEVAICGKVMGPWTLSYHLYGVDKFLMETVLDPEKVTAFMQAFKEISITFALAQIDAGADILTWADHSTGDMVSAQTYEELLFPIHKQCMTELKSRMPRKVPVILHTCGKTLDRMPILANAGFDAFHFDSKNNPAEALKVMDGKILLTGCVSNMDVLLNGSVEDVKRQTTEIFNAGIKLISPECAVPCRVKNENLKAIVDTVLELSK